AEDRSLAVAARFRACGLSSALVARRAIGTPWRSWLGNEACGFNCWAEPRTQVSGPVTKFG
ncbi:MAG: hypothetical protein WAM39_26920, partial [Bryobacteraceae bacterium]